MNRLIDLAERWVGGIGVFAALLLVPLVLATTWEVVSRYAFNAPTIWAYEVGYLLTGSHFLLGLAYTLRQGEHIRIDVLSAHMAPSTRRRIDAAAYIVVLPLLTSVVVRTFAWIAILSREGVINQTIMALGLSAAPVAAADVAAKAEPGA